MGNNAVSMFYTECRNDGSGQRGYARRRQTGFYGSAYDAAIASGMAYLVGELEKVDPKIREPSLLLPGSETSLQNRRRMGRFHVHL